MKNYITSFFLVVVLALTCNFVSVFPVHGATDVKNDSSLSTSLVSYWELEETSGTRVDSHSSNDLTDNNTVLSDTCIQGTCADLEKNNSESFSITDASQSGLDFSGSMSISLWVKFESLPSSNAMAFVTKMTGVNATRAYFFEFDNGWHSGANRLLLVTRQSSSNGTAGYVSWTPSTDTWYHLVAVHDASGASGNGTNVFYINGSAQTTTYTQQNGGAIQNTSATFRVGADDDGGIGRYFDGLIDEVGVWEKALSASEVSDLYNSGSGIPYDAGGGGGGGGEETVIPRTRVTPVI